MTGDVSTADLDTELRAIRDDFGKLNSDDTHYRLFKRLNDHVKRRDERATSPVEADAVPCDDLGELIQSALDRVVAAKTTVRVAVAPADRGIATTEINDAKRYLLRARTLAGQRTVPDIVSGEQARELPPGSRVVIVDARGVPEAGRRVHDVDDARNGFGLGCHYLVLHRAPAPAPKVGDIVTSVEELNALPRRAILRSQVGAKNALERSVDGEWRSTSGDDIPTHILAVAWLPARVLDLGTDS